MGEKQRSERGDDRDLTLEDWLLIFIEFFLWNCDFTLEDRMPVFPLIPMYVHTYVLMYLVSTYYSIQQLACNLEVRRNASLNMLNKQLNKS